MTNKSKTYNVLNTEGAGFWLFLAAFVLGHAYTHANHDKLFIDCVHADPDVVSFEVCADIFEIDSDDLDGVDSGWLDRGPAPKVDDG